MITLLHKATSCQKELLWPTILEQARRTCNPPATTFNNSKLCFSHPKLLSALEHQLLLVVGSTLRYLTAQTAPCPCQLGTKTTVLTSRRQWHRVREQHMDCSPHQH